MEFNIKLANQIISVISQYEYAFKASKEYIVESGEPIFTVCASKEEIQAEAAKADEPLDLAYVEFICLYRKIAELLPLYNCVVIHGAAITYKDSAILFVAPSGTGKSTHIKLWRRIFKDEVDIINGDKPIVCIKNNISVFGTPWAGKENWHKNRQTPLKAICLLKQAKENRIKRVDPQAYLPELLKQIYTPIEQAAMSQTLWLFDQLLKRVPIYLLECNVSQEAVLTAYNAIIEEYLNEN